MQVGIWPELTWTDARTGRTRRIELGTMPIGDIRPTDINQWTTALAAKPDALDEHCPAQSTARCCGCSRMGQPTA